MIRLILASQSPRRKELMDHMGLAGQYEVMPSEYEEKLDDARSTNEVAEELGYGKALWIAERNPGAWVVGSDTIVTVQGKQLEKPVDEQEARDTLKLLSGQSNTVTTSVALVYVDPDNSTSRVIKHHIGHETAEVYFKPYDQALVDEYIATGDWKDKAGSYGVQSGAHILIEKIEGNYDTIIGLPTHTLAQFLEKIGINATPCSPQPPVLAQ